MRLFSWSNTLYACALQDPARILYLCNTASPLDATTSIPTHLSQRMSKTTTTSFFSWRGTFQIALAVAAFFMVDPYIRKLLSFVQEHCIAELSPHWFGACVALLAGYLLKREWDYRKIYVPRPVSLWLILLLGIYLYYRHWDGTFWFWPTSCTGKLAWSDLLLLPWGGAVAIALRSRSKKDRFFLGLVLLLLCVVLYFVPQAQGKPSLVWALLSLSMAVGSCLLGYLILQRWGYRLQPEIKDEAQKGMGLSSLAVDTDSAIVSDKEDWLGFSGMAWILCRNLEMLDLYERSLTVGIIAPWGRGKSSFINLLRANLEQDDRIIVTFNPRGSKSVTSIPEDFFDTFAKELSRHYLGFGLLLARYAKHLGLLNQYEWTRPLGSLLTLLLPGKEQEAVNRTLRELGKRVYVLLDDLDRLSGEEILEVLKLMDRNASFSNTVFITAYDKAYVNNVLKKHLDHGLDHSFIDKYISQEFPLSEPSKEVLERLVGVALCRKSYSSVSSMYRHVQRGWDQIGRRVVESLDSVRDLKRYLNLVIPRYNAVSVQVDCKDYFLLHLLCYKDLGVYLALHSKRMLRLDVATNTYVLIPDYEKELKLVSQWEGSKSILERLFPKSMEEEERDPWCSSLRSVSGFDTYFRGLEGGRPYGQVLSNIINSVNSRISPMPYARCLPPLFVDIDGLIRIQDVGYVVDAFLYLVRSPLQSSENRAETIKTMAYMAFKGKIPEIEARILREELIEFLSLDRYKLYEKLGVIPDLGAYKYLLEPMLSCVIREKSQWVSNIIQTVDLAGGISSKRCVYTIEELTKLLSAYEKS